MKFKPTLPEPERWCDRPASGTAAENAIGAAFRRVRQVTEPGDAAVARLARRMDRPSRSTTARLTWRVALVVALVIAMCGAVGAALKKWGHVAIIGGQAAGEASTVAHARRRPRVAAVASDPSVASAPAAAAESTAAPPVAGPAAMPAPAPIARPVTAPSGPAPSVPAPWVSPGSNVRPVPFVAPPTTPGVRVSSVAAAPTGDERETSSEAGLLARAFRGLRSGGDAGTVLRSLDEYDRKFPHGALRSEARIARAEALIASNRRAEALPLLEGIEENGGAVTRDVRITRGELLADNGRCAKALRDFDAILAGADGDAAGGRALYGRASCYLVAGDVAAARQDLQRYLVLHPDGGFAAAARRALDLPP